MEDITEQILKLYKKCTEKQILLKKEMEALKAEQKKYLAYLKEEGTIEKRKRKNDIAETGKGTKGT